MQDEGVPPSTQPISGPFMPPSNISTQSTMGKPCTCGKEGCPSCRGEMLPRSYVYALGKVMHRFPNKSLEAEYIFLNLLLQRRTGSVTSLDIY